MKQQRKYALMDTKVKIAALIGLTFCVLMILTITVGSSDFLAVNETYQVVAMGCNATYLVTKVIQ